MESLENETGDSEIKIMAMMKLRLVLQIMDLALRFKVSEGRCSNIFFSWLQAIAEYFRAFVFTISKHHNTVKFLDCVAPNLSVTYVS